MMRPSGVLTRFMAHTDYQVRRNHTKKKESVNAAHPGLHLLHGGPTGCLDVIKFRVADDIADNSKPHVTPARRSASYASSHSLSWPRERSRIEIGAAANLVNSIWRVPI